MYNDISFGRFIRKGPVICMAEKRSDFEINPLDINIVKIQHNLLKRLELEMPENGDFAPVIEKFQSKDPTLDLSEIQVACKYVKDDAAKKDTRILEVTCKSKTNSDKKTEALIQGTKKDILDYLKGKNYFKTCKKLANKQL